MSAEILKKLHRQRGNLKARLNTLKSFYEEIMTFISTDQGLNEEQIAIVGYRLDNARDIYQSFQEIQQQIEELCLEENLNFECAERDTFETEFMKIKFKLEKLINSQAGTQAPAIPSNLNNHIKLPIIGLPKFNGNLSNWLEFKEIYESMIHNNDSISKIDKFHYLRSSLSGTAERAIQSITISESNYDFVWQNLCERYQNKDILMYEHIKAIFDIQTTNNNDSKGFRSMFDEINKQTKYLSQLGDKSQQLDALIIFIISNKLDKISLKEWEENVKVNKDSTLVSFQNFITNKAEVLEKLENRNLKSSPQDSKLQSNPKRQGFLANTAFQQTSTSCKVCNQNHFIYYCPDFLKLSISKRYEKTKALNLCTNCLRSGHTASQCTSSNCKKCSKPHNTLLHFDKVEKVETKNTTVMTSSLTSNTIALLSTVNLNVVGRNGILVPCRALLDNGSQSNFITYELFNKLNLNQNKTNISIIGINNVTQPIKHQCNIQIASINNGFKANINCLLLNQISDDMPNFELDVAECQIPRNVQLADPNYFQPAKIDMLIGAQLFWQILRPEQIKLGKNLPLLQNSQFGWLITGTFHSLNNCVKPKCNLVQTLQDDVLKFWQLEENYHTKQPFTIEEQNCEAHFSKTHTRKPDGRFIVSIPFKQSPECLGNSYEPALKRLDQIERKFSFNHSLKQSYVEFMNEYITLGHMTELQEPIANKSCYYLPHHAVIKSDSLTTKCRVVFDASAATDTGISLNDIQYVGPVVQDDLFSILLRFRQHTFVFTADISKMYRQIEIMHDQRKFQRILWRSDVSEDVKIFELNTVTYGTASAPYLATRCLEQLALDNQETYPEAAEVIIRDFYIDDLLSGTDSLETAITLIDQINNIMSSGCFTLTKWCSNNDSVLKNVQTDQHLSRFINIGNTAKTKLLGLQWQFDIDQLTYHINNDSNSDKLTKRHILSSIAKIFDPLGLLSPIITLLKIILQQLWSLHLDWDEEIPNHLKHKWQAFKTNIHCINQITIPRQVLISNSVITELHGFSDASENAYGACIYARSINEQGTINTQLICAKGKVSPLKALSIPRLELCGAVILAKLMHKVKSAFTKKFECFYWTDSKVVLAWIANQSRLFPVFVANRISIIQRNTKIENWSHVRTFENPADLVSRGLQPNELQDSILWWKGPSWLSQPREEWPQSDTTPIPLDNIPEVKNQSHNLLVKDRVATDQTLINNFSSLTKLKRVVAYCYRFIYNCKQNQPANRRSGPLTKAETDQSFLAIIKISQDSSFQEEISRLKKNKHLSIKNRLTSLHPFIDSQGILRVGGRLRNSTLPYEQVHPIILHASNYLCTLIFTYEHLRHYHAGSQHLLYISRQNYWVIGGQALAKRVVRKCIRCLKAKPKINTPFMGNLPSPRLHLTHPFLQTGTDFAGPFYIRDRKGRKSQTLKCYICIFICLSTKAIHLEVLTDLTTNCFLLALRRFIARRGQPTDIFSDNGRTYVKASSDLRELGKHLLNYQNELIDQASIRNVQWHFIPAYAPNFGGLWEAGVKSLKFHLKRVLANALVTFEEFLTITYEIEGILNSRPISPMSNDPKDFQPLSPGHFLIGRPITSLIEPSILDLPQNRLSNYQRVEQIKQHFWTRWYKEYISHLQQRHKWNRSPDNIKEDDLVLIKEDNLPPLCWKTGRVVKVHPDSDGIIRVISIKTSTTTIKRPVSKVCILPIDIEL